MDGVGMGGVRLWGEGESKSMKPKGHLTPPSAPVSSSSSPNNEGRCLNGGVKGQRSGQRPPDNIVEPRACQ